jgi:polysaccharide export outer membrane protein
VMKMNRILTALMVAAILMTLCPSALLAQQQEEKEKSPGVMSKIFGQGGKDKKEKQAQQKKDAQGAASTTAAPASSSPNGNQQAAPGKASSSSIPTELQAGRREQPTEEEAAIVPYYNNFLRDYRLGPEDVISIEVFNQPRYSKSNITIPPNGRVSVYLIPEGVMVVGKTTQQIQEEIQKKYDEYIIDPQVTVSLDKAMSARYSVLGDVGKPGVMIMTRRVSVMEALAEAGGVLNTGDKKKVAILRHRADGSIYLIPVNLSAIEKGKVKEVSYLVPGDQVIVPGNRLKSLQTLMSMVPILGFGRIFGLPF